jgi:outer membrane protein TolC
LLNGPIVTEGATPPSLAAAQPEPTDRPLPINLATALRLAGGRPLVISAAQASVEVAAAQLARAKVDWLPSVYVGSGYYRHDGASQGASGNFYINTREQFMAGGGLTASFATTDAIFAPLAARQVLRARMIDVQAAQNDALLAVAEAYFYVQGAMGRQMGLEDVVDKAQALRLKIRGAAGAPLDPADVGRALALLAEFEGSLAAAHEGWRLASADLTLVLRLDPAAIVVPLEPPYLRVTLIAPGAPIDELIPVGLTNRPELASQQALVQAALARIRQERVRPLIPSLILRGGGSPASPGSELMAGVYGAGAGGVGSPWSARNDLGVEIVWGLENLGLGNRALVRERRAEQQQLLVELFRRQDVVAAEIARAQANLESAAVRITKAEAGLREAQRSFAASLDELGKITQIQDVRILRRRAFEVVDALQALSRAYGTYFVSVNDYNRAQFRIFHALGYPASVLACERTPGSVLPVETTRPPQMAPVAP